MNRRSEPFSSPAAGGAAGGPVDNSEPIIKIESVSKVYQSQAGEFPALKDISAFFSAGEFVSVVGKSGSGKSTLVNMLTGIDHPSTGSVSIGGLRIHEINESDMSIWRGKNLGIVFQFFQLLPMLSILENIMLPMDFAERYPPRERPEHARELLELVGLQEIADKLPGAISGGQQQSAAIARALANDPPILIADEPTGNLDTRTAAQVFDIFAQLSESGKTIIMVTHDPLLAVRCSRVMLLSDGELVPAGSSLYKQMITGAVSIRPSRQAGAQA
jgi:putative ABC transport system ATP-binding protein